MALANPESVADICRQWLVSRARLQLEVVKAGDNDHAIEQACNRDDETTGKLLKELEASRVATRADVLDLIRVAGKILSDEGGDARVISMLKIAHTGLFDLWQRKAA